MFLFRHLLRATTQRLLDAVRLAPICLAPFCLAVLCLAALCLAQPAQAQQLPFDQVVGQLASPDAGTRLSALRLLAESGYPEAALPVAPLLGDPDPRIRQEAMYAELRFFVPGQPARGRHRAAAAAAFDLNWSSMPAAPVPIDGITGLLSPLKDQAVEVRAEAAYALGVLGQVDAVTPDAAYRIVVDALAERLGDAVPGVRAAAARASGRVFRRCPAGCGVAAVERLGDALVRLLNDSDPAVQGAALEGLGEIRYDRAVKGVSDLLAFHKTGEVAWAALDTLARIGHPSSAPDFEASLASKDPNFRRSAVEGLARSGAAGAADAIDAASAGERDASVVLAVAFAQQRMGRARQAARLVTALADRGLRQQAQDYLVELGPPAAPEAASALAGAAPEVRVALLDVLGVTGGANEAPAVEALWNDRDPRVAAAAQRALPRLRRVQAAGGRQ
jgi:HEAT repeat protein